jgi:DNA (cytosine-5)-methyltransferase 1
MARLGLGARWECLFANEWSEKKASAYRQHFGGAKLHVADVASLSVKDLPGHASLAWASFPCQELVLASRGAPAARSGPFGN